MIDLDSDANLSENRRRGIRARMIETVPETEMLVFSPKDPKYTITVFTDIDCGYCRRLHSQIAEYNRLGIRVRYLFFPRSGPDTESWHKAEAVWCASNRNDALTARQERREHQIAEVPADIVARDYELGQQARGRRHAGHLPGERRDAARIRAAERAREVPEDREDVAARVSARIATQVSSSFFFSATPSHCLASGGAAFFSAITGHFFDRSALSFLNSS